MNIAVFASYGGSDCQFVPNLTDGRKLRKDEVEDAKTATSVHYAVGREVFCNN